MRSFLRSLVVLGGAVSLWGTGLGCGSDEIPLADVPAVKQPEPVPIDKLPKGQRPPKYSSANAVLRMNPARFRRGASE